ncbi:MAG: pyruvate, water dikinase regulatory protein [Coriobacteriia bacterium]
MGGESAPVVDVFVVSDSIGETAEQVARAALTQFDQSAFRVKRVPRMSSARQLNEWAKGVQDPHVVVYTFADPKLREAMARLEHEGRLRTVDVMGPPTLALSEASGLEPAWTAGGTLRPGRGYLQWFEALEFAFRHDDGKRTHELGRADVILIGASRTAKTPLSMYLAFRGFAVANIPLGAGLAPPPELFEVDPKRVFGLMTEPELLMSIRRKRASDMGAYAGTYASREAVEADLEAAHRVMRAIGCRIVWTGDRAIEEAAQEIIRSVDQG